MSDSEFTNDKQTCAENLRRHLQIAKGMRLQANEAPHAASKRLLLYEWQAARLTRT